LLEHRSDGGADADLPFVAPLSENVVEVEDGAERNAQTGPDLSPVIPQSESNLQNPLRLQQFRDESPALRPMKLEDEGSIPKGELDHVRAATSLPGVKCGFRFGVESRDTRPYDLPAGPLDRLDSFREVNAFQGKPLEGFQQGGLCFRLSNASHLLMLAGAAFRCRGKRAESRSTLLSSSGAKTRISGIMASPLAEGMAVTLYAIADVFSRRLGDGAASPVVAD
jgi:hypothetical protein